MSSSKSRCLLLRGGHGDAAQGGRADGRVRGSPDHVTTPIDRGITPAPTTANGPSLPISPIATPGAQVLHLEGGGRVKLRPRVHPAVLVGVPVGRGGGGGG